jgi:polyhydroxyalkanoate synthesis regulator phasin
MADKKKKSGFDQKDLDGMVEKATLLGIGLAIVSKEALEDIIRKNIGNNGVSEKAAKQAVNDLVAESKRREKQLKAQVKKILLAAREKSPVVAKAAVVE